MRATINLDDDVHEAIKGIAKNRATTVGQVLSELVRGQLPRAARSFRKRYGVALLPKRKGARP